MRYNKTCVCLRGIKQKKMNYRLAFLPSIIINAKVHASFLQQTLYIKSYSLKTWNILRQERENSFRVCISWRS